jgi:hypothetical protein
MFDWREGGALHDPPTGASAAGQKLRPGEAMAWQTAGMVGWRSGRGRGGTAIEGDQVHPPQGDPPGPYELAGLCTADGDERAHPV